MRDSILIHINGAPHRIGGDQAFETLARFLRYDARATGTKIVCEEGDCGACTVLVGRNENGALRYRPVNSCIQFLFQLDCTHIVTVEGLTRGGALTPLQDAMVRCHGAQCGYCTPGFVMAMAGLFECSEHPTAADVKGALTGNLCRCTGYESIINAALDVKAQPKIEQMYPGAPILAAIADVERDPVRIENFYKPTTLEDAIAFKNEKTVIAQGGTDFGVWCIKRNFVAETILSLDAIDGMGDINMSDGMLVVGGRVSLAQFELVVRDLVPALGPIMDRFGSPQIKNAGTLAGNIANASPIADTLPFLFVTNAKLELTGKSGARTVPIADFYLGYKKLDLRPDEIITRILIPLPGDGETLRLYKISKRSHLDISTFTAAMLMRRTNGRIDSMRLAYGGVAPVVLRLKQTEEFLAGKPVARETFAEAGEIARSEIAPISDVRGAKETRLQLAENILTKFYYDVLSS
ncbi:MAG TPA: FAD binding domain-containing protein [Thermoanaerobaculia bacterium]|jgi:xanthine dehydrogenase small subunit|nr:FAD binding domain-containing protein [Thermoanaerobaculia bacterium]